MIEETTNQLLDTKQTQAEMMVTLDSRGHDLDQLTSRCTDLEERLREAVEQKDFLALELHKAEGKMFEFIYSDYTGGEILPEPKRHLIAQSLSCSPFHRLEMTEILLKGRKTLTHSSIIL